MHSTPDTLDILNIENLCISSLQKTLVTNASLKVKPGKITCLIGESGAGKSLISHAILKLTDKNIKQQGLIQIDQKTISDYSETKMQSVRGSLVSMIFQDPLSSLNPCHTIEQQLAEAIEIHQHRKPKREELCQKLQDVDLSHHLLTLYPHQLSGGQRQRVMIAIALANCPKLLIADECTTALDVCTQQQILDLLKHLSTKNNLSVLLITHNLNIVRYISDDVYVIQNGQIIDHLPTYNLHNSTHPYTQALIAAYALPKHTPVISHETLLIVSDLSVAFPQKQLLFKRSQPPLITGIHFELKKSRNLGIIGESGAGKSTLAKALLEIMPYQGSIQFHYQSPLKIQYVFQDSSASLNPRYTIGNTLKEAIMLSKQLNSNVEQVLQSVNLNPDIINQYPHQLSGGQKQRINLARALISQCPVIILDEPTSALDAKNQKDMIQLLKKLQSEYQITYIVITHEVQLVESLCTDLMVLKHGKLIDFGATHDVLYQHHHPYIDQLVNASLLKR
jgi:ABC-type microcin C transport system duplicated ATPase subunit YejF